MTTHERVRWEQTRLRGKWSYVLYYGLLRWALPLLAVFAVLEALIMSRSGPFQWSGLLSRMYFAFVLFAAVGIVSAWRRWRMNERRCTPTASP
jgi:hypothetical protein